MSRRAQDWAMAQRAGSLTLRAVLDRLAELADPAGEVRASQSTLATMLECDRKTVRRSLQHLEQRGLLRREARDGDHGGRLSDRLCLALDNAQAGGRAP